MKDNSKTRNDENLILWPEEDLILWCRILSKMDMLSWAQLDACGGWEPLEECNREEEQK